MAYPSRFDHRFFALTEHLSSLLDHDDFRQSTQDIRQERNLALEVATDQWVEALECGADPTVGFTVVGDRMGKAPWLSLSSLEVMLLGWSDEKLAWGLKKMGFPSLGDRMFPGLQAIVTRGIEEIQLAGRS